MPKLSVSVLGSFTARLDGRLITDLGYDKVRALFVYLMMEGDRQHRRESLTGLLWSDYPERRARQSLSQALFILRNATGDRREDNPDAGDMHLPAPEPFIEASREAVWFNVLSDHDLDVTRFLAHLTAWQTHQHADLAACGACLSHLQQATALYRGDRLEDLSIPDSIAFEEWALLQRESLRRRMLGSLDALTDAYLRRRDFGSALASGHRQLAMDAWRESAHRQVMQALALDGQRTAALAHFECCRQTLEAELGVEPEPATTALCTNIRDGQFEAIHAPLQAGTLPPAPGSPPYMGLRFFDVGDADRFFGREVLTDQLIARLHGGERFLAIVGASGSGKSSLVRAGLAAALQRDKPRRLHLLTPTSDPMAALAESLAGETSALRDTESLIDAVAADTDPYIIIVDQFEELFTLCRDPDKRQAFVDALLLATREPGKATVVIALRADFYPHCAQYEALRQGLEAHQVFIGAMTPEELRRAIEAPTHCDHWSFEPGLVDLLLKDAGAGAHGSPEPGALPLLSHALLETWRRRQGRMLTLGGYAEAGGVRRAIALSAEAVYRTLSLGEQRIARDIFLRLTEIGDAQEDPGSTLYTRRRASLDELLPVPEGTGAAQTVLDTLASARLITMERDAVEVAHEALIREWPTLRRWLEADMEGLRVHRRLTESAQQWMTGGRDPGDLYRGVRLAQAEEWEQSGEPVLTPLEREFLAASRAELERIEALREAQRQRELAAAQQLAEVQQRRADERGRLLRWLALVAGLLLVAAVTAALLGRGYRAASVQSSYLADANATAAAENAAVAAVAQIAETVAIGAREQEVQQRQAAERAQEREANQRAEAEEARREAELARTEAVAQARAALSNLLVVQSRQVLQKQVDLSLLLSAEAYDVWQSIQSRSGLLTAVDAYPGLTGVLHAPQGFAPEEVLFSPDGTRLAAGSRDAVQVWEVATHQPVTAPWLKPFPWGDLNTLRTLAYSPDGATLVSGGCAEFEGDDCILGGITLWDARTGKTLSQLQGHTYTVRGVAYSPSGTHLASCGDETVLLWELDDAATPTLRFRLEGHTTPVAAIAFSPNGALLASAGFDFDAVGEPASERQDNIRLWDVESGALVGQLPYWGYGFADLTFNATGTVLAAGGCNRWSASACDQGLVQRWDVTEGTEILPRIVQHAGIVHSVHFTGNDRVLLSVPWQGSVGLWDTETNVSMGEPYPSTGFTGLSAVSPDGKILATVHESAIFLWDTQGIQSPTRTRLATVMASYAPAGLLCLDTNPEGSLLATGGMDGQIHLHATATGAALPTPFIGHAAPVWSVAFSPDGATLISGSMDATIRLWDVAAGEATRPPLEGHTGTVTGVAFSPEGALLASCSDDTTVRLWDAATGALLSVSQGMSMAPVPKLGVADMRLWNVAFSPDGTKVAVAVAVPEKVAAVWDVRDPAAPEIIARMPTGAQGGVTQVAFSPDGGLLAASVGLVGQVLLWDLTTYQLSAAPIAAHTHSTWPLAFSPDGRTLASGSLDSTLRLIDVATGALIGPPLWLHARSEYGTLSGLAFSPDGKQLFSSSTDGTLRRWDVDADSWRERACAIAGRNLTQAEWAQYMPGEPYRVTCAQWVAGP